jgi:hypothetical protein
MAAVFALVFLFVLASIGLLAKVFVGDFTTSVASAFAMMTFIALAAGVFVGLFRMVRAWENESGPPH